MEQWTIPLQTAAAVCPSWILWVLKTEPPELDESRRQKRFFKIEWEIYTQEGQDARRFVGTVLTTNFGEMHGDWRVSAGVQVCKTSHGPGMEQW